MDPNLSSLQDDVLWWTQEILTRFLNLISFDVPKNAEENFI